MKNYSMTIKEWNLLCTIAEDFLDGIKVKDNKTNIIGTVEGVLRNGTIIISNSHILYYSNISDIEIIKEN